MMSVDPHYADAEWQVPALRERIAFLEARVTELQASNNEYLDRARNAVEHADANLRTAALNIYRMDWTWAARGTDQPMLIGSKFWVSLRDALGVNYGAKWSRAQQRAAMAISESLAPTSLTASTGSGAGY